MAKVPYKAASEKKPFTASRVRLFKCPPDKAQAFMWDADQPRLGLRVTPTGKPSYVFQGVFQGKDVRITIGSPKDWDIPTAQGKARELQRCIDEGRDPRTVKAEKTAADVATRKADGVAALTVAHVWPRYLTEGKPARKAAWKPRYRADLEKAAAPGGEKRKRGAGVLLPGHLAPLMPLKLAEIDGDTMRAWYIEESKRSPRQAKRTAAMFSGFLRWCSLQKEYRALVDAKAASADALSDLMPGKKTRTDALELDQLEPWFVATDKLRSRVARAYLQALVLTGARREEMAALKWSDIDFRWNKLTLADKVEDARVIPLCPYLASVLRGLSREMLAPGKPNPYVFASSGKSGHIAEPRAPHQAVLADACIPHVSIHGLRRTFALMGEQAGAPAGAIAQVMGHRPSAIAEGYKPRSIDILRPYLAQIESFILSKAKIAFNPDDAAKGNLRLVANA